MLIKTNDYVKSQSMRSKSFTLVRTSSPIQSEPLAGSSRNIVQIHAPSYYFFPNTNNVKMTVTRAYRSVLEFYLKIYANFVTLIFENVKQHRDCSKPRHSFLCDDIN